MCFGTCALIENSSSDEIYLESSQLALLPSQTPLANKKRPRGEDGPEGSLQKEKKNRCENSGTDAMMDRIEFLVKSIEQERGLSMEKIKMFEKAQEVVTEKQRETEAKVENLTEVVESDSLLFTTMTPGKTNFSKKPSS